MTVVQEIVAAIETNKPKQLATLFKNYYPQDIAGALDALEPHTLAAFMAMMSNKRLASLIEVASEDVQREMLQHIPFKRIVYLFAHLSQDDIVDILGALPVDLRKKYLNLIKSKEIESLLQYDAHTAGGLMTTEFISLRSGLTVAEAYDTIKRIAPRTEVIETLFIVDNYNHLVGKVDIRDIFSKPEEAVLKHFMDANVLSVTPDTDQEAVSLLVSKYALSVVPVVNKKGSMLGIITVDDIIDVINEEHNEDLLHLAGVNSEESLGSSVKESVSRRLPWLLINLITAFLASTVVNVFAETIDSFVALAAVMPIVAGMGGNSGTQTVTLVVRSIALNEVHWGEWGGLFHELVVGIINGLITGVAASVLIFVMYGNLYFSLIIVLAMIINLIIAGVFGYVIPLVVQKLNWDPALVSSVFLTTATDVCGFFAFLGLATLFMPLLL